MTCQYDFTRVQYKYIHDHYVINRTIRYKRNVGKDAIYYIPEICKDF